MKKFIVTFLAFWLGCSSITPNITLAASKQSSYVIEQTQNIPSTSEPNLKPASISLFGWLWGAIIGLIIVQLGIEMVKEALGWKK